jgi:hypothetical protein
MKFELSWQIFEKFQIFNFMTILPVVAEFFHSVRQTDGRTARRDEADNRLLQFCESS